MIQKYTDRPPFGFGSFRATLEERILLISPRLTDKQIEKYKEQWR